MYDIFISHSSLDKQKFVEPLVKELNDLGLRIWLDKYNIHKGEKLKDSIINGIDESLIFVAIISKNYYESNWSSLELGILEASHYENILPVIFPEAKDITGRKYPFLLDYNYIETTISIKEIAQELNNIVLQKKQDCGLLHIEKTNLTFLVREMHTYNCVKLEQIAIRLSRIIKIMHSDTLSLLNEIKLTIELLLSHVATLENIFVLPEVSEIDAFLKIDFLNQNIKEHLNYLQRLYQNYIRNFHMINKVSQEELYLIQFSVYSIIEWYMMTYFKKPIIKSKNIITVAPEDFTYADILESYEIEKLVLPPELIASIDTDIEWYNYNPLTIIGARDAESGKLIGFFTTLPISDDLYHQIRNGNFDDTTINTNDIRQYDIPGFYKLYLCSFCIHPKYNTTSAFKVIYTNFIDFLLNLASERDIYISSIIADGVTLKGANLCKSIGMTRVTTSIHNSTIYEATLIPPALTTLKFNNIVGHRLITYYERMYNEYKDLF